jgi:hypothetical protein
VATQLVASQAVLSSMELVSMEATFSLSLSFSLVTSSLLLSLTGDNVQQLFCCEIE